ncbi:hypothetical protein FN846DRAFT_887669 [Sphaerosporella brunnea]|uniref:Uncharacterized protein n=1 Tax=Sphaerosporella brunnea TaxID=1250544 RepID=A0A5J5F5P6_9PEZI|nr:hypothetical protein FN846DRAFT_887669 [Sphaerosporella brunnea]
MTTTTFPFTVPTSSTSSSPPILSPTDHISGSPSIRPPSTPSSKMSDDIPPIATPCPPRRRYGPTGVPLVSAPLCGAPEVLSRVRTPLAFDELHSSSGDAVVSPYWQLPPRMRSLMDHPDVEPPRPPLGAVMPSLRTVETDNDPFVDERGQQGAGRCEGPALCSSAAFACGRNEAPSDMIGVETPKKRGLVKRFRGKNHEKKEKKQTKEQQQAEEQQAEEQQAEEQQAEQHQQTEQHPQQEKKQMQQQTEQNQQTEQQAEQEQPQQQAEQEQQTEQEQEQQEQEQQQEQPGLNPSYTLQLADDVIGQYQELVASVDAENEGLRAKLLAAMAETAEAHNWANNQAARFRKERALWARNCETASALLDQQEKEIASLEEELGRVKGQLKKSEDARIYEGCLKDLRAGAPYKEAAGRYFGKRRAVSNSH